MLAYLLITVVEILVVFTVVLMMVAYMTLMERKVLGHIQVRFGPNRVGPGEKVASKARCGSEGLGCGNGKARYTRPVIRNIIFDWSGTLVDDLPAVWQATNYVLAQAQRPEMTLEQFRAEFCLPFTIFYDRHTPNIPLPQLEEWFHSRFRQVQDSVCALPHARDFLEFCRARSLRTFRSVRARMSRSTPAASASSRRAAWKI